MAGIAQGDWLMGVLIQLSLQFLLISFLAFGGASATLPEMHRFLVVQHHWIDDQTFSSLYAISQAAPGPNVLFVALFGWQVAGLPGAICTLFAMCIPAAILALLFEHYASRYPEHRWHYMFRRALAPITVGLVMATALIVMQGVGFSAGPVLLAVVAVWVTLRTKYNPLWLIGLGALLGALGWI
ncbi:chromate transporter [Silvimonas soli]|uniref:chromate transporter n=1 Tax=Silvimonas soli TaxID=2980100 RepID=UPI0024B37A05|nr:chromate transporter [Silvimonas soli]